VTVVRKTELTTLDGVRLDVAVHRPESGGDKGTAIYVHGITSDMDEFGMGRRAADAIAESGRVALRFSFRGHGGSGGTQRGVTLAGEMLDLEAVVEYAATALPQPLSVVASSFGAVSTLMSLPWLDNRLHRLVLLRPVLDLRRTFIEPETPWGRHHFPPAQQELLTKQGFILVNGTFEPGWVLFEELRHHDPTARFLDSTVPTLVVHGDKDSVVSYEIARDVAAQRASCRLHTVIGADHGFDNQEDEVVDAVLSWLMESDPREVA
jgi:uncharacterized protein